MTILNTFILLSGILCIFLGVFYFYKKNDIKEKIMNGLFAILGLAVSILSTENTNYYNTINNLNEQIYSLESNLSIENNNEINATETSTTENIINSNNQITNNTVFENSSSDEGSLMNYANFYYTSNNLEGVVRIYGNSKLANNPVALTNLGYMYANGIYFEQNFEIAEKYYDQAISLGFEQAICNKLAMYLKNKLPDTISVLNEGFENRNDKIARFVSSNYYMDKTEYNMAFYYDFYLLSNEEKINEIESWYYWDEGIIEAYYEKPYPKTAAQKFVFIRFFDEDDRVGRLYTKYEMHCYNIEMLEERFIIE